MVPLDTPMIIKIRLCLTPKWKIKDKRLAILETLEIAIVWKRQGFVQTHVQKYLNLSEVLRIVGLLGKVEVKVLFDCDKVMMTKNILL